MKKRDKFWLNKFVWVFTIIILFLSVSFYNMLLFNSSYISEEKAEIDVFMKQVEWAVIPIIKSNKIEELQKYCDDFKDNDDFAFRIFDKSHNLLAGTNSDKTSKIAQNDTRLGTSKYNLWKLYKQSFDDKDMTYVNELVINNSIYYIELSISQKNVIDSIVRAQKNIIILFTICLILLLLSIIQLFSSIRKAFNTLEDSVINISKGELDTKIKIPRNGLLEELALSVTKMTQKLKKQIERLSKLEQYKTEFLQNLTHEIKTPLTAIYSAIELIENPKTNKSLSKECFDIIKFQTNSINKLVNDILALSEIDLQKTEEIKNFTDVNLIEAIKEAVANQGITASAINLIIKDKITVPANKKLLVIAISNLLSNAIKYSNSAKIDITLRRKDNLNIIEIKDYGVGISEKDLPHIFERFYRVDKSRSRQSGGTGLGLSIVKNIIELHNWKIEVSSIKDKGTIFKIII